MTPTQTPTARVVRFAMPWPEQRAHALALEERIEDSLATRTRSFRCGTGLFNDDFPRAGALNVLRVESAVPTLDPAALMQFTDELQAGLPQRSLRVVEDRRAEELRPAFAAAGWVTGRTTLMAPRRRPDRPVDLDAIREVSVPELFDARQVTLRRAHRDNESAEQLLAANALPADGLELRCFAATVGCEVAAYAVARVAGEVAKIVELDAFVRSHGHGLGRAIIWATVTRLRADGVRLVVVEAEDDTWPKWTFRRLGFEDIAHTHRFVRPWGGADGRPPAL